MARVRVSTTVDEQLLMAVRRLYKGLPNSVLLDGAFGALLAQHRAAEVDASYAAYDDHPINESNAWGDWASFRETAVKP